MGIFSKLLPIQNRKDPVRALVEAVEQIKLGIYWRLSRKYENAAMGRDGYSLAYAVVYEIFADEAGKASLGDFVPNRSEQISREVRDALNDDAIYQAVSIAFAGEVMSIAAFRGEVLSDESQRLVDHATDLGVEVANIARDWGYGTASVLKLAQFAKEFRRDNAEPSYEVPSRWRGTTKSIGNFVLRTLYLLVPLVLLVTLIKGLEWVANTLYPLSLRTAEIGLALLPICLLLAIFRKSRGIASLVMLIVSYALGFNLWLYGLVMAVGLAGVFWTIIGLLFAGIGVVPVAAIASVIRGEWAVLVEIIIMTVVPFAVRAGALLLAGRSE